ncbi:MAG: hypothetical protein RTU30_01885 [Candidatus Thorarchaeota archaeon]
MIGSDDKRSADDEGSSTRDLLDRFKNAIAEAQELLANEEYQQAMALYYDASQSADEMCERFFTLLMKTAPSNAHRTLLIEVLSWRIRYLTAQHDYHLAVAQTLTGLPREEWIARLEAILILSQSLIDKLLPVLEESDDPNIQKRVRDLLRDWVIGVRKLVSNLNSWGMASSQASRVLEWALDNGLDS